MSRDQVSVRVFVATRSAGDEFCFVQWAALHGSMSPLVHPPRSPGSTPQLSGQSRPPSVRWRIGALVRRGRHGHSGRGQPGGRRGERVHSSVEPQRRRLSQYDRRMERAASPEHRLQWLVDRAEIAECLVNYARCIDRRDWAGLQESYTDDGVMQHGEVSVPVRQFPSSQRRSSPGAPPRTILWATRRSWSRVIGRARTRTTLPPTSPKAPPSGARQAAGTTASSSEPTWVGGSPA